MFKIVTYVEDKRVGDVLRAIAGIVRGHPEVVPMVNAEEHPTTKKLVAKTGGSLLEMFERHLIENKVEQLKPNDVRAFVKSCGKSPASAGHLVILAIKARLLRRTGMTATVVYHVTKRIAHG